VAAGFIVAFAAGIMLASVLITTSGGGTELSAGQVSSSNTQFSPAVSIILWLLCTAMGFVAGWLVMRVLGWVVVGMLPRGVTVGPDGEALESTGEWRFPAYLEAGRTEPVPSLERDPVPDAQTHQTPVSPTGPDEVPVLNAVVGGASRNDYGGGREAASAVVSVKEEPSVNDRHVPDEALIDKS